MRTEASWQGAAALRGAGAEHLLRGKVEWGNPLPERGLLLLMGWAKASFSSCTPREGGLRVEGVAAPPGDQEELRVLWEAGAGGTAGCP